MHSPFMRSLFLSRKAGVSGLSTGSLVLCILMALVMILGGVIVYRSVEVQGKVAVSYVGWYEDYKGYEKALADQKVSKKPILLYFYATWCPHCKHFASEILADDKMRQFVQAYPHVRVAPDNGAAEKKLMSDFGAPGYPTFYVVRPDQKRTQVDTFVMDEHPHLKTPKEFMKSILQATGGA